MPSQTKDALATIGFVVCWVVAGASFAADRSTDAANPARLEVSPLVALEGDPVSLHIRGLRPGGVATVHAQSSTREDGRALPFYAAATFMGDANGDVDLATTAPVRGDYHRADLRGLFWSQRPLAKDSGDAAAIAALRLDEPASVAVGQVVLTLESRGQVADRKVLTLLSGDPAAARQDVSSEGLVGAFYYKKGMRKRPVIVVVGGSEGGLDVADWIGPKLASRGFAVFGLNYFSPPDSAVAGVPTALKRIPVELLEKARAWLGRRAEVVDLAPATDGAPG